MKLLQGIMIAALLVIAQQAFGQLGKVMPVDQADRNPSFLAFRAELLHAVQRQDTAFVLSHLYPEIGNSFGGDGGIEEFKEQWFGKLMPGYEYTKRDLMSTIEDILTHGGRVEGDSVFIAPYWFTEDLPDDLDSYFHMVIIGESVPVRSSPGSGALLASLSYDVVADPPDRYQIDDVLRPDGWTAIMLRDSTISYVPSAQVRSPIGYRMTFHLEDGRWWITNLIAGD